MCASVDRGWICSLSVVSDFDVLVRLSTLMCLCVCGGGGGGGGIAIRGIPSIS